ncbi:hypothetical protein [Flavobacterium sp.]|jgi:hypothetical protein|uniref:hypothetical protein n=1 Tax=Flavobacterium sp. TaxID=239 RepID=UPI0037BEA14B
MPRPIKYNKPRTIKFSEVQDNTLNKLASFNINVAEFIRQAISEKLQREKIEIIKPKEKNICPF